MDFWLISYVCYNYDLPLPLICAPERFHDMRFVSKILRLCGGFFVKNSQLNDKLFSSIFKSYTRELLQTNHILELFIEGKRQTTGKVMQSDNHVFDIIAESFLEQNKLSYDLKIVPITINYERVYEGEAFPFELTGETRSKEVF
jgi:glycerol-3-phosphate O-acyltransferase